MRMPQREPENTEYRVIPTDVVNGQLPPSEREAMASERGYAEWDRSEWVGEGQEPPEAPQTPLPAETEPRWTKWEWVGEGQGAAGPRRGLAAEAMPEGANALSGHRHNPGMEHWAGRF